MALAAARQQEIEGMKELSNMESQVIIIVIIMRTMMMMIMMIMMIIITMRE